MRLEKRKLETHSFFARIIQFQHDINELLGGHALLLVDIRGEIFIGRETAGGEYFAHDVVQAQLHQWKRLWVGGLADDAGFDLKYLFAVGMVTDVTFRQRYHLGRLDQWNVTAKQAAHSL